MKRIFAVILSSLFIMFSAASVNADIIHDTGDGSDEGVYLNAGSWSAAEFTIDVDFTITDIETQLRYFSGASTQVWAVLYNDDSAGGLVPGTPVPGASAEFTAGFNGTDFIWVGLNELDWFLPAGTYWVAFEVSSDYDGDIAAAAPYPLGNEAYTSSPGNWAPDYYDADIAVRLEGDPAVVPIPSSLVLISMGLLGIVGLKRKTTEQ